MKKGIYIIATLFVLGVLFFYVNNNSIKTHKENTFVRLRIKDSVFKLAKQNTIYSQFIGYSGSTANGWYLQQWLLDNCTFSELKMLKNNKNHTVKALAYKGLLIKSKKDHLNLFNEAINDSTCIVYYQIGCVSEPYLLAEYLRLISDLKQPTFKDCIKLKLSEQQKKVLNDKIIKQLNSKELIITNNHNKLENHDFKT